MSISPALKTDIPALVQLINSAYRGEGAKKGWTTEADLLDGTRTDEANLMDLISDPQTVILKYTDDADKILACVNLQKQDNRLYLGMLTVSPQLQGAGIGKKLLVAADDYAREHGCLAVFMTVISVRSELIAWYERHGFHKTGEVKPFPVGEKFGIQKQPLEMIVMEKKLTDVNAR
jgi:ribosomal protein S18 acetylase RimI-like enzyme